MGFREKARELLAKLSPGRSSQPEMPELPEGSSDDDQENSRKQHEEFLREVAELPKHVKGISYALFRLAGHINEPLPIYRMAAVRALKAVGLKIVAKGRPGRNGAKEILVKRWKAEKNTHIIRGIQQAVMEIDAPKQSGQSQN